MLTGLVEAQNERYKQGKTDEPTKVDSFKLIRSLYKSGGFNLAKNKKRFDSSPKKYDGLIHDGLLCLRGDKLSEIFQKMKYSNTLTDVHRELVAKEALFLYGDNRNKKVSNMRVYGIYIDKLK